MNTATDPQRQSAEEFGGSHGAGAGRIEVMVNVQGAAVEAPQEPVDMVDATPEQEQ